MASPGFSTVPYPGLPPLPPPVDYPEPIRRVPRWAWIIVAAVLLTGLALLLGVTAKTTGSITSRPGDSAIQRSVQGYFDAMAAGDITTLARNAGCGFFDETRDRGPEMSLMRMTSESFIKETGKVSVISVDKVVRLSGYQLRVLFTVRAQKIPGSPQGQAELLMDGDTIYVCSAYLRSGNAV